jgi:uncharacterized protein YqgQ
MNNKVPWAFDTAASYDSIDNIELTLIELRHVCQEDLLKKNDFFKNNSVYSKLHFLEKVVDDMRELILAGMDAYILLKKFAINLALDEPSRKMFVSTLPKDKVKKHLQMIKEQEVKAEAVKKEREKEQTTNAVGGIRDYANGKISTQDI